jgi:hypothetical protein
MARLSRLFIHKRSDGFINELDDAVEPISLESSHIARNRGTNPSTINTETPESKILTQTSVTSVASVLEMKDSPAAKPTETHSDIQISELTPPMRKTAPDSDGRKKRPSKTLSIRKMIFSMLPRKQKWSEVDCLLDRFHASRRIVRGCTSLSFNPCN